MAKDIGAIPLDPELNVWERGVFGIPNAQPLYDTSDVLDVDSLVDSLEAYLTESDKVSDDPSAIADLTVLLVDVIGEVAVLGAELDQNTALQLVVRATKIGLRNVMVTLNGIKDHLIDHPVEKEQCVQMVRHQSETAEQMVKSFADVAISFAITQQAAEQAEERSKLEEAEQT